MAGHRARPSLADQHRIREAEAADAGGDLRDLGVAVAAGITGRRHQPLERRAKAAEEATKREKEQAESEASRRIKNLSRDGWFLKMTRRTPGGMRRA